MIAPVTNPVPVATMGRSASPAFAVWGLKNVNVEEDVWVVKFVLN
jgi:hypothetical protein